MNPLDSIDTTTLLSGQSEWIDDEVAAHLARHPLDCIDTEFPHVMHSIEEPTDIDRPRTHHPIFFGCYDWHSSVHSHWCLLRQLRLIEDHPFESDVRQRLDAGFTSEHVADEVAYFETNESFEKPYGWAWFLRLAAELQLWEHDRANQWRDILRPLEARIVDLVETEFLSQVRPFRVGTHGNSAFALQAILDYARVTGDRSLEAATVDTSRAFFLDDEDWSIAYEPLGWDFLSPGLVEADLLRRVLHPDAFSTWLETFLPDVTSAPAAAILEPVAVEPEDGIELHLVGLNLSRAWCLLGIAEALEGHRYVEAFERSAARHAERGVARAFTVDYAGAHWLSSFVVYLLTRNEGGIAPSR